MKHIILILILLLVSDIAFATEFFIQKKDLANLQQQTEQVQTVERYSGQRLLAGVKALPGQSFVLKAPMNIQQLAYLTSDGQKVEKGDPMVRITGHEVHHFYSQYKLYKKLYEQSETLFANNKVLFEKRSIDERSWLEISEKHLKLKLIFDEYNHFFEYVTNVDEQSESLTVGSPISGVVTYSQNTPVNFGEVLADIIPLEAIRLQFNLPINSTITPISVVTDKCELSIELIANKAIKLSKIAYSKTIQDVCGLVLDQQIAVTPQYEIKGYLISKYAVFSWDGRYFVFIAKDNGYVATAVNIISSSEEKYVVTSASSLTNEFTLVTSVSAAQGILMGLGE